MTVQAHKLAHNRGANAMQDRLQLLFHTVLAVILAVSLTSCASGPQDQSDDFGYADEYEDDWQDDSPVEEQVVAPSKPAVRIALRDDVPGRYIVKSGDTLWDISTLFLRDPWLWPEIWYFNPQIDNPHLIYPGDVLTLVYVDGQPQLRLSRDGSGELTTTTLEPSQPSGLRTVKLSPNIRSEGLEQAIPTIPIAAIEPFLIKPRIITADELEKAPYIISSLDQHLVTGIGNTIYARNLSYNDDVRYNIYRPGRIFRHPRNDEILGYEMTMVSEAKLVRSGDPATLSITRSARETLNGDRILPADRGRINYNFIPRPPMTDVEGTIIALIDAISQTAQSQVVVINLGEQQGIEVGTVLAIDQAGAVMRDRYTRSNKKRIVRMPDHRAGLLMVFRVFDQLSYGLIVDSTRTVHVADFVRNPASSAEIISR